VAVVGKIVHKIEYEQLNTCGETIDKTIQNKEHTKWEAKHKIQNTNTKHKYKIQMHCKQNHTFAVSICVITTARNDVIELTVSGSQYYS
jgi:hypothetical protein